MVTHYDVIIVGAGPAGCTCALGLRDSGLKVLLLDKEQFPRDKICGDAINPKVNRILRKIDPKLETELRKFALKSIVTDVTIFGPDWNTLKISSKVSCYCIKRIDFDNWLFQKLKPSTHITVLENTTLKKVQSDENGVTIETHLGQQFHSKLIVGCDGTQSVMARQLAGFKMNRSHFGGAVRQYYQNIKGLNNKGIEIYILKGYLPGYFWIFPVSDHEANVGFGMLSQVIAQKKIDMRKYLNKIIQSVPELASRFATAMAVDEIKGFGLAMGSQKCNISGNRFLLCGDAASLIDPISGEGIETAMESGQIAAEQILQAFVKNDFTAKALKSYDHKVYRKMWGTFKKHYYLQRIVGEKESLVNILFRIGNIPFIHKKIQNWFSKSETKSQSVNTNIN